MHAQSTSLVRTRALAGTLVALLALTALVVPALADDALFARMETEKGNILLVFYPELAPNHVDSFVNLARQGFFDGTRFHRIVPGFVIQGGDPNSKDDDPRNDGAGGPSLADVLGPEDLQPIEEFNRKLEARGYAPIALPAANLKAEFSRTVKHLRGTLSMARSRDVDSAGSQFFICVDATPQLDGQYTIFGHVVSGMEAADAIVSGEKNPSAGRDAPAVPVAIDKLTIISGAEGLDAAETEAWEAFPAELKNVK